ncbi:hypothetical protein DFH28DRAFT_1215905 [Melampsora americana]|nr:hypothetical protein DFH28DRAFT_1215905 [Melampsora americana]
MKFGQIFISLHILMDHHASGSIIPQIFTASSIQTIELAEQTASRSSGVVYPLITQQFNEDTEDLAKIEERTRKDFGPQSTNNLFHRKIQQAVYTPPTVKQMNHKDVQKANQATDEGFNSDDGGQCNKWLIAIGTPFACVATVGIAALWVRCLRLPKNKDEPVEAPAAQT